MELTPNDLPAPIFELQPEQPAEIRAARSAPAATDDLDDDPYSELIRSAVES